MEGESTVDNNPEQIAAYEPCRGAGVRIVCISDTHARQGSMRPLPQGDVLIHAGDFTNTGSHFDILSFTEWMDAQPFKHKIFIAGNHDTSLHTSYFVDRGAARFHSYAQNAAEFSATSREIVHNCKSTYLEDSSVTISYPVPSSHESGTAEPQECKFDIFGSPWQPEFCDWAFNLERGPACAEKWAAIPDHTDILITHGPPKGYGDKLYPDGWRCGCEDLLRQVKSSVRPPRLHVFGHIHEDGGKGSALCVRQLWRCCEWHM